MDPVADTEHETKDAPAPATTPGKGGRKAKEAAPTGDPIVQAEVTARLQGLKPGILFHPMDQATLEGLYFRQPGSTSKGNEIPPPEVLAASRFYRNEEGRICLPTECLMAALIEAGRSIPYEGKSRLSNADSSKVPGIIGFEEEFLPIFPNPEPNGREDAESKTWETHMKRGVLQGSGTAVAIVRPRLREWYVDVSFSLNLEGEPIGVDKIKRCFDIAGKSVGVGSWRPQCKGSFGRFRIADWLVETFTAKQLAARAAEAK